MRREKGGFFLYVRILLTKGNFFFLKKALLLNFRKIGCFSTASSKLKG